MSDLSEARYYGRISEMLAGAPRGGDTAEALDAFVKADEAVDRARSTLAAAEQRRERRLEALERAIEAAHRAVSP